MLRRRNDVGFSHRCGNAGTPEWNGALFGADYWCRLNAPSRPKSPCLKHTTKQ